jgi:hypothetical protein
VTDATSQCEPQRGFLNPTPARARRQKEVRLRAARVVNPSGMDIVRVAARVTTSTTVTVSAVSRGIVAAVVRDAGYVAGYAGGKGSTMTDQKNARPDDVWEVVTAKPYDRGNPADGAAEDVVAEAGEAEARRVYADQAAVAADMGYEYVKLRCNGRDVESWPQATGWTC